jgi:hypothetical protein
MTLKMTPAAAVTARTTVGDAAGHIRTDRMSESFKTSASFED